MINKMCEVSKLAERGTRAERAELNSTLARKLQTLKVEMKAIHTAMESQSIYHKQCVIKLYCR